MNESLNTPLTFAHGPAMPNRLMLAPMTNLQSHEDGTLSDDEYRWLVMRAAGGFGLTMTCAAHVQAAGKGFPGQLGIWSDHHLPGLERLAKGIRIAGGLSAVQLHHAGMRSPRELVEGGPVAPWDDAETGARALTTAEVDQVIEDFIAAAQRAERAGFDGVEIHGAHGYLLAQFLDAANNRRDDRYGGDFDNRIRPLLAVIDGVRERTGPAFQIGARISPERFGVTLDEAQELARRLLAGGRLDYLDLSLWDVFKEPIDPAQAGRSLIDCFIDLPRGATRLGVAGKLMGATAARACLEKGADFVLIGRAGILHHDFPLQVQRDPRFESVARPVSRAYLAEQGLGTAFIDYMATGWKGFVAG